MFFFNFATQSSGGFFNYDLDHWSYC